MNSNKRDPNESKVTENQTKNDTKLKTSSAKSESIHQKSNERTSHPKRNHKTIDESNGQRIYQYNYHMSYSSGDNHNRRHNDHYFYNSNRFKTNESSDRNRRWRPIHDENHSSNYVKTSNTRNNNGYNDEQNSSKYSERFRSNRGRDDSHYGHNPRRRHRRDNSPEVHEDLQQKLDEITALKSIFDENILTVDENELKGRFLAEPVLNENKLTICYTFNERNRKSSQRNERHNYRYNKNSQNSVEKSRTIDEFCVQHLPPIELYFELSRKYPSKLNPMFLISCKWLSRTQLDKICQKLEELYFETRMEVLFIWFSFLQNDVLRFLGIEDKLDISSVINQSHGQEYNRSYGRHTSKEVQNFKPQMFRGSGDFDSRAAFDRLGTELIPHLKAYNEYKRKDTFNKSFFVCNICFSSHLGEDCVVFPCNHMNCKKCITDYFMTLIKEGTVHLLKCPDIDCQTTAPNSLVRELITGELFERYDRLMLDSLIGTMSDAHYCPRQMCGNLVVGDPDSSLAHCNACGHAFCKNCKQTYHGIDPCNMFRDPQKRKEILERYQNANATERTQLEKVYGKKQLTSAVEEAATDKWLEDMSKRCPHCKASIEKSDGCNKMSCWRCNTFFCWLCLQRLPLIQPYSHFNNPESKCYNQLFRGVEFDAEDMFEDDFE